MIKTEKSAAFRPELILRPTYGAAQEEVLVKTQDFLALHKIVPEKMVMSYAYSLFLQAHQKYQTNYSVSKELISKKSLQDMRSLLHWMGREGLYYRANQNFFVYANHTHIGEEGLAFTGTEMLAAWFQLFLTRQYPNSDTKFLKPFVKTEYEQLLCLNKNQVYSINVLPWQEKFPNNPAKFLTETRRLFDAEVSLKYEMYPKLRQHVSESITGVNSINIVKNLQTFKYLDIYSNKAETPWLHSTNCSFAIFSEQSVMKKLPMPTFSLKR